MDLGGKKVQVYVHGSMNKDSHVMLTFKEGLPQGDYVLMYKAGFSKEHPERKLSVSLYADKEVQLTPLDDQAYNKQRWLRMECGLFEQMHKRGRHSTPPTFEQIRTCFKGKQTQK